MSAKRTRINLELNAPASALLDDLAKRTHGSKSDVIRRALVIMNMAVQAREMGRFFGIVDKEEKLDTSIVGV